MDFEVEWSVGARRAAARGNKIIFAGNGGSAGIASHMATDYSKNGGLRAWAMNDGSMLTCLANDYGYEHVFAKQIEFHGRSGTCWWRSAHRDSRRTSLLRWRLRASWAARC